MELVERVCTDTEGEEERDQRGDEVPDGQSRLVSVLRFAGRPRWLTGALAELFFRPAHLIMSDRQLVNLRRRVEHG